MCTVVTFIVDNHMNLFLLYNLFPLRLWHIVYIDFVWQDF